MGRTQLSSQRASPTPHFLCHMAAFASLGFVDEAEAQRGWHACPRPHSQSGQSDSVFSKQRLFPARTGRLWTPYPTPSPLHIHQSVLFTQELPASGLVSEVLKETRVNLGPLANRAMWGFRDPVGPWETVAPKD